MRQSVASISQQVLHTYREFQKKACERRGLLAALAQQIASFPIVRERVLDFSDREKYPSRPMITLHKGEPSVYLLGWRQGDFTDIHDHGDCEVGVYCMEGVVTEDIYIPLSVYGPKRQLALAMSRSLREGDLVTCPKQYIHRMGNLMPEVAATLHVYGPVLNEMRLFDVVQDILTEKGCWGCHQQNAPH